MSPYTILLINQLNYKFKGHIPLDTTKNRDLQLSPIFWSCVEYLFHICQPIRFVQFDRKLVNLRLPVLDPPRPHKSWCWPNGSQPLGRKRQINLLIYICEPLYENTSYSQKYFQGFEVTLKPVRNPFQRVWNALTPFETLLELMKWTDEMLLNMEMFQKPFAKTLQKVCSAKL